MWLLPGSLFGLQLQFIFQRFLTNKTMLTYHTSIAALTIIRLFIKTGADKLHILDIEAALKDYPIEYGYICLGLTLLYSMDAAEHNDGEITLNIREGHLLYLSKCIVDYKMETKV